MCARGNSRRQDGCDPANDSFRKSWLSEALTFGAHYICNASLCRETCRDEPFSAKRPFSTGVDVETEHGGASSVTGCRRSLDTSVEVQRTHNT